VVAHRRWIQQFGMCAHDCMGRWIAVCTPGMFTDEVYAMCRGG
jgi:hypothetical protein